MFGFVICVFKQWEKYELTEPLEKEFTIEQEEAPTTNEDSAPSHIIEKEFNIDQEEDFIGNEELAPTNLYQEQILGLYDDVNSSKYSKIQNHPLCHKELISGRNMGINPANDTFKNMLNFQDCMADIVGVPESMQHLLIQQNKVDASPKSILDISSKDSS